MFPICSGYLFTICMFVGVTLFIYYLLEIEYSKIIKSIKEWAIYMKEEELPKEKEKREELYSKIKNWINSKQYEGEIYINKYKNWRKRKVL